MAMRSLKIDVDPHVSEIIDILAKKRKLVPYIRNAVTHYASSPKGKALFGALVGEECPGPGSSKQKRSAAVKETSVKPAKKDTGTRGDDVLSSIFSIKTKK